MYPLNYSVLSYYFLVSLQEIQPSLEELALDTYGRKVLMYLVGPRSPAHFHPNVVELFKKGDGNSIRYRQSHDCTNSGWIIQSGPRQVLHGELKKVLVAVIGSSSLLLVCRFHLFLDLLVQLLDLLVVYPLKENVYLSVGYPVVWLVCCACS